MTALPSILNADLVRERTRVSRRRAMGPRLVRPSGRSIESRRRAG